MREMNMEEMKTLQLEIMNQIHDFCESNNIHYSLAYGSLIGAIRHKGYIPWDDDIDIVMTRPDYITFITHFNGSYNNLRVISPENNHNFYAPYANVIDTRTLLLEHDNDHRGFEMGVKIDIFPLDGVCNNDKALKYFRWKSKLNLYKGFWVFKKFKSRPVFSKGIRTLFETSIFYISSKFLSFETIQAKFQNACSSISLNESQTVDNLVWNDYAFNPVNKSVFDSYITVPFENYEFNVVKNYDSYLRGIYGDYMELPPVEKRNPHHNFTAYWK